MARLLALFSLVLINKKVKEVKTMKKIIVLALLACVISGCATVPLAPKSEDQMRKQFAPPESGMSGIYIYRDQVLGAALKKTVAVNGKMLGETASKTYLYTTVQPGENEFATESEFGDNVLRLNTSPGRNYFLRQVIKMGVFSGGSVLQPVSESVGKHGVRQCSLAESRTSNSGSYTSSSSSSRSSGSSRSGSYRNKKIMACDSEYSYLHGLTCGAD